MKTLLLMRHAKSDWGDASLRDYDRPLAERGRRDAPEMAKALREIGSLPDAIISSPALRARQTAEAFIREAGLGISPEFNGSIYEASTAELMKVVREIPDSSLRAMMVGHNPGFEGLLARLTGAGERMPTAAIACIELPVERWGDVEEESGRLLWLLTPKTLGGAQG